MNTNFKVIGLTRLGIKPKFTTLEVDALTTQPSDLFASCLNWSDFLLWSMYWIKNMWKWFTFMRQCIYKTITIHFDVSHAKSCFRVGLKMTTNLLLKSEGNLSGATWNQSSSIPVEIKKKMNYLKHAKINLWTKLWSCNSRQCQGMYWSLLFVKRRNIQLCEFFNSAHHWRFDAR